MFTFSIDFHDGPYKIAEDINFRVEVGRDDERTIEIWDIHNKRWVPCVVYRALAEKYLDDDPTGAFTEYLVNLRSGRRVYDREMHRAAE